MVMPSLGEFKITDYPKFEHELLSAIALRGEINNNHHSYTGDKDE